MVAIAVRPAHIVTIAMIVAVAGVTPVIVPVAPLIMAIVDPRGVWPTSERDVIVIAVALVSVSRVACAVVVARIDVEHRPPSGQRSARLAGGN